MRFGGPSKIQPEPQVKRYEVGYEGELIGVYAGGTPEEAINACRADLRQSDFTPATPIQERMQGLIANELP